MGTSIQPVMDTGRRKNGNKGWPVIVQLHCTPYPRLNQHNTIA
jgi:hypothetical protein